MKSMVRQKVTQEIYETSFFDKGSVQATLLKSAHQFSLRSLATDIDTSMVRFSSDYPLGQVVRHEVLHFPPPAWALSGRLSRDNLCHSYSQGGSFYSLSHR